MDQLVGVEMVEATRDANQLRIEDVSRSCITVKQTNSRDSSDRLAPGSSRSSAYCRYPSTWKPYRTQTVPVRHPRRSKRFRALSACRWRPLCSISGDGTRMSDTDRLIVANTRYLLHIYEVIGPIGTKVFYRKDLPVVTPGLPHIGKAAGGERTFHCTGRYQSQPLRHEVRSW